MQWLIAIESDHDLISTCRLFNIFRRKGLKVLTLSMVSHPAGYSLLTMVETPESEAEHIFNYLRRTQGVEQVTWYRQETSGEASFIFVDSGEDASVVTRILQAFPQARQVFANLGKYLFEIPAESGVRWASLGIECRQVLPLSQARSSRAIPNPELVVAQAS